MINLFERRRGFRVVELVTVGFLVLVVLVVYLTKAAAGREGARLAQVNSQIRDEERRLKLLRAELAYLEQPRRLERLAVTYLDLQPVSPKRETQLSGLVDVAHSVPPARAPAPGAPR